MLRQTLAMLRWQASALQVLRRQRQRLLSPAASLLPVSRPLHQCSWVPVAGTLGPGPRDRPQVGPRAKARTPCCVALRRARRDRRQGCQSAVQTAAGLPWQSRFSGDRAS